MAAPPEMTCKTLSGRFVMNKTLSDDVDPLLILQGLSWFTRKAIKLATVVLTIKEYEVDSLYHIDITSVASGLSSTQEDRVLDWSERDHTDKIFGHVKGKSRFFSKDTFERVVPGSEDEKKFLLGDRLDKDGDSKFLDDVHVQSVVFSQDSPWNVEQIWGFEEIEGKRYYTRRVVGKKGDKTELLRLVYDFRGPLEEEKDEDDGLAY